MMVRPRRPGVISCLAILVLVAAACGPSGATATREASLDAKPSARAFVRVNQVGYLADEPKHAFLLAGADETGTPFEVLDAAGTVVASARSGRTSAAWSERFPHVHAIDVSTVTAPGVYKIRAETDDRAVSPPFAVGDPSDLFAPLLGNALRFFQAQRDGPDAIGAVLNRQGRTCTTGGPASSGAPATPPSTRSSIRCRCRARRGSTSRAAGSTRATTSRGSRPRATRRRCCSSPAGTSPASWVRARRPTSPPSCGSSSTGC